MAKKSSYSRLVKKMLARAKREANPAAAKMRKKKRLQASADKMSSKMTGPEIIFAEMMSELEIEFETQKVVGAKIYDFYIPSKNLLIEIHGDYWHANPIIYENKELNKIQIRNQKNDKYKETLAKGNNYSFYIIWEYDLKNNYEQQKEVFKDYFHRIP